MEKRWSQNSNSHIDWMVTIHPLEVPQDEDHQWRPRITTSNSVVPLVRRWFVEYCATMDEMNDLFSSFAKELAMKSMELNTLSSSSTGNGTFKSLFHHAGLFVCCCALYRLRCHDGLTRSGKNREAPHAAGSGLSDGFGKSRSQLN